MQSNTTRSEITATKNNGTSKPILSGLTSYTATGISYADVLKKSTMRDENSVVQRTNLGITPGGNEASMFRVVEDDWELVEISDNNKMHIK